MALDTKSKRASALGSGLLFLVSLPDPASGIDAGDRQQASGAYRGLLASAEVIASHVPPPIAAVTYPGQSIAAVTFIGVAAAAVTYPGRPEATVET